MLLQHWGRWDLKDRLKGSTVQQQGQAQARFEGHSDWVNDVVVAGSALVTCSSDCTLRTWDAHAQGTVLWPPCLNLRT